MADGDKKDQDGDLEAGEHFMIKEAAPEVAAPADIVDEPSGVIRAMQREAASIVAVPVSLAPSLDAVPPSPPARAMPPPIPAKAIPPPIPAKAIPPPIPPKAMPPPIPAKAMPPPIPAKATPSPTPANVVPTDIDLDAVSRTRALDPKPVLEYFADGDISDVFDDEPTRPWLDPLPTAKKPSDPPLEGEEDEVEEESTIIGGGYDPSVDRSGELVTIKHGKSLSKLKSLLANCIADPDHNFAGINFNRLEENIRGIGKTSVLDKRLTLVRTRKNLFLVSNENLVELQNRHHELMGIDLTKSSLFRTISGKPIFFTLVTGADLEILQKAGTEGGKLTTALQEARDRHVKTTVSLLLPEVSQLAAVSAETGGSGVDLADFKAKLAMASRDPEGIVYADPKVFAEMIVFVMSFYDGDGAGYYYITTVEGGEEISYLMYVTPRRPANPDMSYASFLFGNEFCTLIPEE